MAGGKWRRVCRRRDRSSMNNALPALLLLLGWLTLTAETNVEPEVVSNWRLSFVWVY
jgi:hypothetical protein